MCAQVTFPQKAKVVTQGEAGDAFFVVETGILAVVKDGKPVMRLSPGQARSLSLLSLPCRALQRCRLPHGSSCSLLCSTVVMFCLQMPKHGLRVAKIRCCAVLW